MALKRPNYPPKPRRLNLDREINDEDIWLVEVRAGNKSFQNPYRKSSLQRQFDISSEDWDCTVLRRYIQGDPLRSEDFTSGRR